MRLLLDTHVLIWWDGGDALSTEARHAISSADEVYVSAASAWEVEIKRTLGKISGTRSIADATLASGFVELPVLMVHTHALRDLAPHHRDPFDRLLVAQSMVEELVIVTRDPFIAQYGVPVIAA